MKRIFLDFETFYDKTYTLRKMSPAEYILNANWETLGCAVAVERGDPVFLPQDEIKGFLEAQERPYAVITHNALFDATILAYRYNIHPDALVCTLSMARALLLHEVPSGRVSLKELLKHIGSNPKGDFIQQMSGVHYNDLMRDSGMMMGFIGYALNDVQGCRDLFFHMCERFPAQEAFVLDRMIRMVTQPKLQLNLNVLSDYKTELQTRKQVLLDRIRTRDPEQLLMSNLKFAGLLRELGVDPPMKVSPTTGKQALAFARTDHAFMDLLEHDDPDVQALVAARLGIKSTIEETRTQRLISIALCANSFLGEPFMPMPLKYCGAHTTRYSGDWTLNVQNLGARKTKALRSAIIAPEGYTIVAVDAAQIEARLVAWLCGQEDLLEQFANGEDTYRNFASTIFGVAPGAVTKAQRFVGKTCILGLGFGMSDGKLYRTIVTLAREQAIDIEITMEDCIQWVQAYRRRFRSIQGRWYGYNDVLAVMARGQADGVKLGPCTVEGTTVMLPSGLKLFYDNLRLQDNEYWYDYGRFTKKIYGAKLLENIVQALDRQHVVEAGIRAEIAATQMGIEDPRVLLNIHDENVHCVPDEQAETMARVALDAMRTNSIWSKGLPLAAEVKWGRNFGELIPLDIR